MLKRRSFWIVLLAVAVLATGAATLKRQARPAPVASISTIAPATLEFLPGDLTVVEARHLRQIMTLTGSLRPVNQVMVKARVPGQVREVLVREGEAVQSGQLLLTMDPSEFQARVDQARGTLEAARGQLDIATRTRDNNQALLAKGFISENAYTTAASQYEIAHANLDSARGALDGARKSLADTVIRAPLSGLVSSRTVQPGEKVAPDNRLLDIVDLRQLELAAAVPAADVMRIAVGQKVEVSVEGLAEPVPGTVVRINPATESGSRSIMTYIRIDNPRQTLRAGMFAEARTDAGRQDRCLDGATIGAAKHRRPIVGVHGRRRQAHAKAGDARHARTRRPWRRRRSRCGPAGRRANRQGQSRQPAVRHAGETTVGSTEHGRRRQPGAATMRARRIKLLAGVGTITVKRS